LVIPARRMAVLQNFLISRNGWPAFFPRNRKGESGPLVSTIGAIERYEEQKRDRWLSDDELRRLCTVLDDHNNPADLPREPADRI